MQRQNTLAITFFIPNQNLGELGGWHGKKNELIENFANLKKMKSLISYKNEVFQTI